MANALPTTWLRFFSKRKNMKNSPYDGAKKKRKTKEGGLGLLATYSFSNQVAAMKWVTWTGGVKAMTL